MTTKKTATANRAAMDNAVKKPRITHVDIVLDTEVAEEYERLVQELDAAELRLQASQPRRLAAVRASFPADTTPEAQAEALQAVLNADDAELAKMRDALEVARQRLAENTRTYKFRALGRAAWEALKEKHPATDEDHELTREATGNKEDTAQWHVDTLAPELVQAASVSPRLTAEDVDVIWNGGDWNDTEVSNLFQTALMAQVSARTNPLARR